MGPEVSDRVVKFTPCQCPWPRAVGSACRTGGGYGQIGGHLYTGHWTSVTFECAHRCGAWMSKMKSDAPEGIDPWGDCPKKK